MNKKLILMALICLSICYQRVLNAQSTQFNITIDQNLSSGPLTGNVYVMMTRDTTSMPIYGPDFIAPEPFLVRKVSNWNTSNPIIIDESQLALPTSLTAIPRGYYAIQAVVDINTIERSFVFASGNLYSDKVITKISDDDNRIQISIGNKFPPKEFINSENLEGVKVNSAILSKFYNRPTFMEVAVILPQSYHTSNISYPTVYVIPGFGGTHYNDQLGWIQDGIIEHCKQQKIYVVLNPESALGHHVFANSENNGPRANSLIEELIPYLESKYRMHASPEARFLFGHSSGGWSSIWLMVNYPEYFGGAWATAPDPLDFRSFFGINIYREGSNAFTDEHGNLRVLERLPVENKPSYKLLSDRELAIGDGEQYGSFEAVFSPRGEDGKPLRLWNRETGKIDSAVAAAWAKYDITQLLNSFPKDVLKRLNNKIHIYVGDRDTYYLDHSVKMFHETSSKLFNISVKYFPEEDHYTILSKDVYDDIEAGMNTISTSLPQANK
ncbi:hypothetical protein C900_02806 [Fulvivirga imtechensis AK7]|uniref:Esterase n=1 Tax=Fulvivirga imtechensis AK7 TaxID=1237149 RepID=L8JT25_9BACT|nr:alpha/beta hydrolase [Fulvivirga imtechensis]ELR71348.1 hypothetical protein C900_02806 [Fulvivirga imtechensis AK7]